MKHSMTQYHSQLELNHCCFSMDENSRGGHDTEKNSSMVVVMQYFFSECCRCISAIPFFTFPLLCCVSSSKNKIMKYFCTYLGYLNKRIKL